MNNDAKDRTAETAKEAAGAFQRRAFEMILGHLLRLESELSRHPQLEEAAQFVGCAALSIRTAGKQLDVQAAPLYYIAPQPAE